MGADLIHILLIYYKYISRMVGKSRKSGTASGRRFRKTRKTSNKSTIMSIPQIRTGLQYIDKYGKMALEKTDDIRQAAADFANEWYAVFQKKLSMDDAIAYMKHVRTMGASTKQKGGSAPLDYVMRPGLSAGAAPHGVFLPYVSSGFEVGVPKMSSADLCAAGGTPALLPFNDTGSNTIGAGSMKGGGRRGRRSLRKQAGAGAGANFMDTLKQVWSHPAPAVPSTVLSDAVSAWRGQPIGPGGDSTTRAYGYVAPEHSSSLTDLYKSGTVKAL
jgi:hypothetical protein